MVFQCDKCDFDEVKAVIANCNRGHDFPPIWIPPILCYPTIVTKLGKACACCAIDFFMKTHFCNHH